MEKEPKRITEQEFMCRLFDYYFYLLENDGTPDKINVINHLKNKVDVANNNNFRVNFFEDDGNLFVDVQPKDEIGFRSPPKNMVK